MKAFLLVSSLALVNAKVYFKEVFDEGWEKRWIQSKSRNDYGKFEWTCGDYCLDDNIKGIKTSQDSKFYSISANFDKFSNENDKLVIQYTARHEQDLDCGGGYIKVMSSEIDSLKFDNQVPFYVMFGPDICGGDRKIHVILSEAGKGYLIKKKIPPPTDNLTHLYTLIIDQPSKNYSVLVDEEEVAKGNLLTDWDMVLPKTIKDPNATKPANWDENEFVVDASAKKPAKWEDEPRFIPDPNVPKPEDWDDDLDGIYEPTLIPNPKHKGEWSPPLVKNPNYFGKWIHPEIANPKYNGESIGIYKDVGTVGFELWQVRSGTLFSNIIITNSLQEAKEFGEKTWKLFKHDEMNLVKGIHEVQDKIEENYENEKYDL